jgi:hypothetical protein
MSKRGCSAPDAGAFNAEIAEDAEDAENPENPENIENIENIENTEGLEVLPWACKRHRGGAVRPVEMKGWEDVWDCRNLCTLGGGPAVVARLG